MNIGLKNLRIVIIRPFFVLASQVLYQRVQGEKAHPMAPLSCVWPPLLSPRNRNIICYQATASLSILPSIVIALHGALNDPGPEASDLLVFFSPMSRDF